MSQITAASDLEYWMQRLRDKERCTFPILDDGVENASIQAQWVDVKVLDSSLLDAFCRDNELKLSTVFQTAWALVVRSYTDRDDVCFGYCEDSQLIPRHLVIPRESGLRHVLDSVDTSYTRDSNHRSCNLADIEASLNLDEGGLFNTELWFRQRDGDYGLESASVGGSRLNSRSVIGVEVESGPGCSVSLRLRYRHAGLSDGQALNVSSSMEMALLCVLQETHRSVGEQSLFSEHHQRQVKQWDRHPPEEQNLSLHGAMLLLGRV
ncbi:uncharacterized protein L3040_002831 [Drepanopeziza brunnea f. sp. 'multigermtubi']|nr:hypothetical protein L3040_002831 [Drepanopeziza brunnea f. sp. 'multigermtubi']